MKCFDNRTWTGTGYIDHGVDACSKIIRAFLKRAHFSKWEDGYKLKTLECYEKWEIASDFPRGGKSLDVVEMESDDKMRQVKMKRAQFEWTRPIEGWLQQVERWTGSG